MSLHIRIVADTNDADYVTNLQKFDRADLPLVLKCVEAIKACKERHNWPRSHHRRGSPYITYEGILTEEEIDIFGDMVPSGEDGVHSIETVEIFEIINREVLL